MAKEYIGSEEHFEDMVNAYYDEKERIEREQIDQINKQIMSDHRDMKTAMNLDNALLIDKFMGYAHPTGTFMYNEWNQIMPVVEKIEGLALFSFHIGKQFVRVQDVDPFNMRTAISVAVIGRPKIEAVHQAVVEFIKWYNENKS